MRCTFSADIYVASSLTDSAPSPNIDEGQDSEQETDIETEGSTGEAPSTQPTATQALEWVAKTRNIVTTIMEDDTFRHLKPLRDVVVHRLLEIREGQHRPPGELDSSYDAMAPYLLYTRLERLGAWCKSCHSDLKAVYGCNHGWECRDRACRDDMGRVPFCSRCLEFGTASTGNKRLRWGT